MTEDQTTEVTLTAEEIEEAKKKAAELQEGEVVVEEAPAAATEEVVA
jgi:hypothetical protein